MSENKTPQKKPQATSQSGEPKKKSDEQILFPEAKVGDITIKPWSFGKLFDLSILLEVVLDKVEEKKINLDFESGIIPYTTIARLFTIASPEVLKIMSITLDKSEEEVRELGMEDGMKIAMVIYQQNSETIKEGLGELLNASEKSGNRKG